ncbi:uncharacterized protein LOC143774864 [Ranitomeya variabilis]|uniref:uncharacterized protein LOC143774864 n=1 Tax=Ranitomeya variabilis TaxID=490064 RepID=UPI004055A092
MNGKSDGTGRLDKDKGFVNVDVFKTVENNGSTIRSKCKEQKVSRIALLALILLIGIILIIFVCAFNSMIVKQLKIMNLKVSQSVKTIDTAQENIMDKMNELKSLALSRPSCPDGWYKIRSACYYFSTIVGTWQEANDTCIAQKSQLLIVTSPEEIGRRVGMCCRRLEKMEVDREQLCMRRVIMESGQDGDEKKGKDSKQR